MTTLELSENACSENHVAVEIILVAFNSGHSIESCLDGLRGAAGNLSIHVTVVDNASDQSIIPVIEKADVKADLLRLNSNRGYAGGVNAGLDDVFLAGRTPDAILLLNPDVDLPVKGIEHLYALLLQSPGCGAISPEVASSFSDVEGRAIPARFLSGFPMPLESKRRKLVSVDRLPGCCMLIRPTVFEQVGVLDEEYFLYWEEIDFCVRARKMNYELLIARDLVVVHHADGKWAERQHRVYYMWRNQVRFALKHYGRLFGSLFVVRRLVANVREIIGFVQIGKPSLILAGAAGLLAGLRGETGPGNSGYAVPEK